jgi:hypothetical protein
MYLVQDAPLRAQKQTQPAPYRIAIVGMGPRGLSVFESLAKRLMADQDQLPVEIYAIDAHEVGVGRIWRSDQPAWFLMNTITSQVTIYSGQADQGPWRPGAGPCLYDWLQEQDDPAMRAAGPNDCVPRVYYGLYLHDAFQRIKAALPEHVRVEALKDQVVSLSWQDEKAALSLQSGLRFDAVDKVVLCTGHPCNKPSAFEAQCLDFAARHPGLTYIPGNSALDMPLEAIRPGEAVGLLGLGLGFYDVLMALTEGRGGRFEGEGEQCRYVASGREPVLLAGSRSGLPIPARGQNQKKVGARYAAVFFTQTAIQSIRRMRKATHGTRRLDFKADLLPLIEAEIALVYYKTLIGSRHGEASKQAFAESYIAAVRDRQVEAALAEWGLADEPAPDLEKLSRPFAGLSFADPGAFTATLLQTIQTDIVEAQLGNLGSPLKAALDVIRDIRDTLREAADFGGLTHASYQQDFLASFSAIGSLLAAGPPIIRAEQTMALIRAGVLTIVGPDCAFERDEQAGAFAMSSHAVAGSRRAVTALIDCRVPLTRIVDDTNPLMIDLVESGQVVAYRAPAPDDPFETEGMFVTDKPFHVVDASGRANSALYALGIPTEFTRWFTQVGSGTPNTLSRFTRDADAIAADVLSGRRIERVMQPVEKVA